MYHWWWKWNNGRVSRQKLQPAAYILLTIVKNNGKILTNLNHDYGDIGDLFKLTNFFQFQIEHFQQLFYFLLTGEEYSKEESGFFNNCVIVS